MRVRSILFDITLGIIVVAFLPFYWSCNRTKKEGQNILNNDREKLVGTKPAARLWPHYDPDSADTRSNKRMFKEFLHFTPGPDVRDLYYNYNLVRNHACYFLAFHCQDTTVQRIISVLQLHQNTDSSKVFFDRLSNLYPSETSWWDGAAIKHILPFVRKSEVVYWFLWYDTVQRKVFFQTFDN